MTSRWKGRLIKIGTLVALLFVILAWNWSNFEVAWAMHTIQRLGLRGEFSKATPLCQHWLARHPVHPQLHELAGFLAIRQGDVTRGAESYAQAITLGLKVSQALDHLVFGRGYLDEGHYQKSLAEFRQLTLLRPRQTEAWYGLGLSWHGVGHIQKAIDAYKIALYRQPNETKYRKILERAINDRRRGTMTYMADAKGEPLAQWRFGSGAPLYMRGYHAAHVVGYRHPKFGTKGLEAAFRDHIPGSHVTLSLDIEIQYLAEQAFEQGSRWGRGSMIVMHPSTGEIVAMISRPTFNPNRLDKDWSNLVTHKKDPLLMRVTDALYETGSIAKIVTAAAWLEASNPPLDPWPLTCTGALTFDKERFLDWKPHGPIASLGDAMDVSCNIAFAKMGLALGPQALLEKAKKFGFEDSIPFDWKVTPSTFPPPAGVDRQTAELAAGLGAHFQMTPLQGALILAAVANDGVLMQPTLVKSVHGLDGHVIAETQPKVWRRVMSKRTARELKQILVNGVTQGISQRASVEGLTVGGKTGTSGSSKAGLHAWFGCFAPAKNPQYVVLVMVEHGGMGMSVAAPIAHKFFTKMIEQGFMKTTN